eukprot:scaffold26465_cov59-Phaeocystis_antarctica.AAC.4
MKNTVTLLSTFNDRLAVARLALCAARAAAALLAPDLVHLLRRARPELRRAVVPVVEVVVQQHDAVAREQAAAAEGRAEHGAAARRLGPDAFRHDGLRLGEADVVAQHDHHVAQRRGREAAPLQHLGQGRRALLEDEQRRGGATLPGQREGLHQRRLEPRTLHETEASHGAVRVRPRAAAAATALATTRLAALLLAALLLTATLVAAVACAARAATSLGALALAPQAVDGVSEAAHRVPLRRVEAAHRTARDAQRTGRRPLRCHERGGHQPRRQVDPPFARVVGGVEVGAGAVERHDEATDEAAVAARQEGLGARVAGAEGAVTRQVGQPAAVAAEALRAVAHEVAGAFAGEALALLVLLVLGRLAQAAAAGALGRCDARAHRRGAQLVE